MDLNPVVTPPTYPGMRYQQGNTPFPSPYNALAPIGAPHTSGDAGIYDMPGLVNKPITVDISAAPESDVLNEGYDLSICAFAFRDPKFERLNSDYEVPLYSIDGVNRILFNRRQEFDNKDTCMWAFRPAGIIDRTGPQTRFPRKEDQHYRNTKTMVNMVVYGGMVKAQNYWKSDDFVTPGATEAYMLLKRYPNPMNSMLQGDDATFTNLITRLKAKRKSTLALATVIPRALPMTGVATAAASAAPPGSSVTAAATYTSVIDNTRSSMGMSEFKKRYGSTDRSALPVRDSDVNMRSADDFLGYLEGTEAASTYQGRPGGISESQFGTQQTLPSTMMTPKQGLPQGTLYDQRFSDYTKSSMEILDGTTDGHKILEGCDAKLKEITEQRLQGIRDDNHEAIIEGLEDDIILFASVFYDHLKGRVVDGLHDLIQTERAERKFRLDDAHRAYHASNSNDDARTYITELGKYRFYYSLYRLCEEEMAHAEHENPMKTLMDEYEQKLNGTNASENTRDLVEQISHLNYELGFGDTMRSSKYDTRLMSRIIRDASDTQELLREKKTTTVDELKQKDALEFNYSYMWGQLQGYVTHYTEERTRIMELIEDKKRRITNKSRGTPDADLVQEFHNLQDLYRQFGLYDGLTVYTYPIYDEKDQIDKVSKLRADREEKIRKQNLTGNDKLFAEAELFEYEGRIEAIKGLVQPIPDSPSDTQLRATSRRPVPALPVSPKNYLIEVFGNGYYEAICKLANTYIPERSLQLLARAILLEKYGQLSDDQKEPLWIYQLVPFACNVPGYSDPHEAGLIDRAHEHAYAIGRIQKEDRQSYSKASIQEDLEVYTSLPIKDGRLYQLEMCTRRAPVSRYPGICYTHIAVK